MRSIIVAYVIVAGTIILLCLLCPYGSRVFELTQWWPVVGTLAAASIGFVSWDKGMLKLELLKRILPVQIAFFLSVPVAAVVGSRNSIYIAEVAGVVTRHYVGGHALNALEVQTVNGDLYRIEGLPSMIWDAVLVGDAFIKNRGFLITVGGHHAELFRDGRLWKSREPTQGEQDGTGQPATRPESKSISSEKPQPESEGAPGSGLPGLDVR